jgi:hypothetical protein
MTTPEEIARIAKGLTRLEAEFLVRVCDGQKMLLADRAEDRARQKCGSLKPHLTTRAHAGKLFVCDHSWHTVAALTDHQSAGEPVGEQGNYIADALELAGIDVINPKDTRNPTVRSVLAHAATLQKLDEEREARLVSEAAAVKTQEMLMEVLDAEKAKLAEVEVSRRSIAHRAYGIIDALLLYATCYPNDSHAEEGMGFAMQLHKALGIKTLPRVHGQIKPLEQFQPVPDLAQIKGTH